MKLYTGAPTGFLEEGAAGDTEGEGEQVPLRAGVAVDDEGVRWRLGGGGPRSRGFLMRLAAGVVICVGLLGIAAIGTWPRIGGTGVQADEVVELATGDGIGARMTYDDVTMECRRYVRDTPCSWTERYSCPGQEPRGAMGVVPESTSEDYRCCCNQGLWRGLPQTSTTTANTESPELAPKVTVKMPTGSDECGLAPPAEAWFPSVTGMHIRSTSTTTTTQQPAAPPVCEVSLEDYKTSRLISAQCAQLDYWKQTVQEEAAHQKNHSYCHIDPRTKVMTCQRQEKCVGGEKVRHRYTNKTKIMTYHCDSHCTGTLYFGCCGACEKAAQTPESIGVDKIECDGCGEETKNQVTAKGEAHCEVRNGTFQCRTAEECRTGRPSQTCELTDYICNVYPCSTCQTRQLKAECCVQCLTTMCSRSPAEGLFCEACGRNGAGTDSDSNGHPWWTLGLGR